MHAICVLAPGVIPAQHPVRPVSQFAVEFDRREVARADFQPDCREAAFLAGRFRGSHHAGPNSSATVFRRHRDGQDPAHRPFEQQHHRCRHAFGAVFDEGERALVTQDPIDVVPAEPVLPEAQDFETVECAQIIRSGNSQGVFEPRGRLLSFST